MPSRAGANPGLFSQKRRDWSLRSFKHPRPTGEAFRSCIPCNVVSPVPCRCCHRMINDFSLLVCETCLVICQLLTRTQCDGQSFPWRLPGRNSRNMQSPADQVTYPGLFVQSLCPIPSLRTLTEGNCSVILKKRFMLLWTAKQHRLLACLVHIQVSTRVLRGFCSLPCPCYEIIDVVRILSVFSFKQRLGYSSPELQGKQIIT